MLFNSYTFILLFLPIAYLGFFLIGGRGHHRVALSWLIAASLFFYGWWNPAYLGLIVASILFNYALGVSLSGDPKRSVLLLGVISNLALLAYFKYANFFVDNLNALTELDFNLAVVVLPLAISFFTFQQVAYLMDAYQGQAREYNFLHYCLFVTFFPQLIAGPIVHHKEMLPQFARESVYKLNLEHLATGISIFVFGLFKKVVIADGIATYATPVFNAAESGVVLSFVEAWTGALAYTFQLYFDFSGYSDMAIGLAFMIGIRLPLNFFSPYKAVNITEFWRRWHMTLSRFLRDYLYIPLGGSRKGKTRRYVNLMITMLLGGLWHGAGWTFVVWGALHGSYLIINHGWHALRTRLGHDLTTSTFSGRFCARTITFVAVVVGWVFFRATSFDGAFSVLSSMVGINGISLPSGLVAFSSSWTQQLGIVFTGMYTNGLGHVAWQYAPAWLLLLSAVAWFLPNTLQIIEISRDKMRNLHPGVNTSILRFSLSHRWALIIATMSVFALANLNRESEFLYFQF